MVMIEIFLAFIARPQTFEASIWRMIPLCQAFKYTYLVLPREDSVYLR